MVDAEVLDILHRIDMFKNVYEIVRVVDPIKKEVVSIQNQNIISSNVRCFDFWGRNNACDNCISIKAYHENKSLVKLEHNINGSYLVMAIPYALKGRRIIIELLKDISDSYVLDSSDTHLKSDLYSVIDNLNNLLMKDALTEVYNRRYIIEKLPVDIINANLLNQQLSLLMFDIDYFKKINDNYGHQAGDVAIKGIAVCAASCLERKADWIARYGGEEFVVCLPGADKHKAFEIAERIRVKIQNEEFTYKDYTIKSSASFGISNLQPGHQVTMEQLIESADRNLYKAKQNGRNRIEM